MILADSSAWIEYLRRTESRLDWRMHALLSGREPQALATTEVVVMEVLAGARDEAQLEALQRAFAAVRMLPVGDLRAYEAAAEIARTCRQAGEATRSYLDCLVAAVAIRERVPVLHQNRDFEAIARHTPLSLAA